MPTLREEFQDLRDGHERLHEDATQILKGERSIKVSVIAQNAITGLLVAGIIGSVGIGWTALGKFNEFEKWIAEHEVVYIHGNRALEAMDRRIEKIEQVALTYASKTDLSELDKRLRAVDTSIARMDANIAQVLKHLEALHGQIGIHLRQQKQ